MNLTKWQPFQEALSLRETFDSFFDDPFFRGSRDLTGTDTLALDILERDGELLVRAAAPGFEPDDIDVSVQGNLLTLSGSTREERSDEKETYHLREYRMQNFQRSVRLPHRVNPDDVRAEYKNGMLTVHLPRAEEDKPKRITVQQE